MTTRRHTQPTKVWTFRILLAMTVTGTGACTAEFVARFNANLKNQMASSEPGKACGDGIAVAALIPDCPLEGVCFTSACEGHDSCYLNCEDSRAVCDGRFYNDMTKICYEALPIDSQELRQCLYTALVYFGAVEGYGAEFHKCSSIGPPPAQLGACCTPGAPPVCADVVVPVCPGTALFFAGQTCAELEEIIGGCPTPPNDDCTNAIEVCTAQVPDPDAGHCVSASPSEIGDRACRVASQNCLPDESCLPYNGNVFVCTALGDNRLASTDGPDLGSACGFDKPERFQADVWFSYAAPCSGRLSISMCLGTQYDAVLAVYGTNDPQAGCLCPEKGNGTLLACDDDSCGGFETGSALSIPGVVAGACYTIRVGGWSSDSSEVGAARGFSQLDIGTLCE